MKIKNYNIRPWTNVENKNIAVFSDIHLSSYTTALKETTILENLEKIKPSQIVVAGGLYDGTDEELFEDERLYKSFLRFIKEMSEIAPIYFTLTGYEIFPSNCEQIQTKNVSSFNGYLRLRKFINDLKVNELKCYLLGQQGNAVIKDGDVTFSGLNIDSSFFTFDSDNARRTLCLYEKYLNLVTKKLNNELYSILILHDPLIFKHVRDIGLLNKFNLVIGGTSRISKASKLQNVCLYPESLRKKFSVGYTDMIAVPEDKMGVVRVRKR